MRTASHFSRLTVGAAGLALLLSATVHAQGADLDDTDSQEQHEQQKTAESPAAKEAVGHRPRRHPQRDRYLFGTFGPPGLVGAAISSGFQQWRGAPPGWSRDTTGYFKRFTAQYGQSAISDTTKYLLAVGFNEDPSFRPCECKGVLRRLRHAVLGPISARKPDGRIVLSSARVAGITAGEVVAARSWYPGPLGVSGVATHVGVSVAGQVGVDILREFFFHRKIPLAGALE